MFCSFFDICWQDNHRVLHISMTTARVLPHNALEKTTNKLRLVFTNASPGPHRVFLGPVGGVGFWGRPERGWCLKVWVKPWNSLSNAHFWGVSLFCLQTTADRRTLFGKNEVQGNTVKHYLLQDTVKQITTSGLPT